MSGSYESFASVYDTFMNNIPYEQWSQYLFSLLQDYDIQNGNLVELGCGTGTLCKLMQERGFHITGIDLSGDMIKLAKKKLSKTPNIILSRQNMCELILNDELSYDGFYSLCDSMNYLLYDEELLTTFQCVRHYLKENGVFIFDLKTEYFYKNILGNHVFCDHQKDGSYIWENNYFEDGTVNQYELTIFIKQKFLPLYKKYEEIHHQKVHELSKIIDLLTQAGLEYVTSYDAFTKNPTTLESQRIYIIAKKTSH